MRIAGEILSVETNGESLVVKCQGKSPGVAAWRPFQRFSFEVPSTKANAKSLYIGRLVNVTIKVKS